MATFLPFLHQTDCCPGCTNVQTVSSLHLNPYRIKVKGILSSDYSSNLLNNVLRPSFSAAAEFPPSLMIQPPTRTTLPFPLSLSPSAVLSFFGVCFCINPQPFQKTDRGDSTPMISCGFKDEITDIGLCFRHICIPQGLKW